MEDLLEAISDNVSAIVLALARKGKAVGGDIVPATETIKLAVDRMCATSQNTARNPGIEEEARRVLLETSGELSGVSARLVAAARESRDGGDGQRKAMKESKELLRKVTLLLMLEDQININFLVQSGKRVEEAVARAGCAVDAAQAAQAVPEATLALQDFLRRVRLRADVTRDGSDDKKRFLDAVAALQRAGPAHTAAVQQMVRGGGSTTTTTTTATEINAEVDEVIRLARAIFARNARFIGAAFAFRAPTSSKEDRLVRSAAAFMQATARTALLSAGDPGAVEAFYVAGVQEAQAARGVGEECADPVQRRMVSLCAGELEGLLPRVQALAREVRARPAGAPDPTKEALLRMLAAVTQGCGEALRLVGVLPPDEAVAANGLLCTRCAAELSRAIESGDSVRARAELAALDANMKRYVAVAELRAEDTRLSPEERAAALEAAKVLRALHPRIVAAAAKALADKKAASPAAIEALLALSRELATTRDLLSAHSVQGAALATVVKVECEGLTDTVRLRTAQNYQQLAVEHAKDAARALQQMQLVARAALDVTDDVTLGDGSSSSSATTANIIIPISDPARRSAVEEALAQSTPAIAALITATKAAVQTAAAVTTPAGKQAYAALEAAADKTKRCADRIAALLRPTEAEVAEARARAKAKAKARAALQPAEATVHSGDDAAANPPRPGHVLAVEGPHDEHILHAAQIVVDSLGDAEQSKARASDGGGADDAAMAMTPEGKVFRASHEIADLMAQLASLAALDDREGMIGTGRKIASSTNAITTYAQPIAAQCTDPTLRGDVLNYSQSAQNYAVQLKILCAVKAASAESDPDDDTVKDQLVTAANGLASSIVSTAKSCQSASIHIRTHNNSDDAK